MDTPDQSTKSSRMDDEGTDGHRKERARIVDDAEGGHNDDQDMGDFSDGGC